MVKKDDFWLKKKGILFHGCSAYFNFVFLKFFNGADAASINTRMENEECEKDEESYGGEGKLRGILQRF
ncbi:hypothetical protein M5689_003076 [Euphorbia peplus]|nr:hypothetical protein M5689_003076 [Euphorbia peplus]